MKTLLWLVLLFSKLSFAAGYKINTPVLEQLGFVSQKITLPSGQIILITTDTLTNSKIVSQFSPIGRIERSELRTRGGALIQSVDFEGSKQITSIYKDKVYQTELFKKGDHFFLSQNGQTKQLGEDSFYSWCEENPYDENYYSRKEELSLNKAFNKILNGGSVLIFAEGAIPGHEEDSIGMNTLIDSCEEYPRGGIAGLADDFQKAMTQGLTCLGKTLPEKYEKLKKEDFKKACPQKDKDQKENCKKDIEKRLIRLRYEAIRMIESFSGLAAHFKINCKTSVSIKSAFLKLARPGAVPGAVALVCEEDPEDSPGMEIFLDGMKKLKDTSDDEKNQKALGILFHEMAHLVGLNSYPHADEIDFSADVPYLMESCCFGHSDTSCKRLLTTDHKGP